MHLNDDEIENYKIRADGGEDCENLAKDEDIDTNEKINRVVEGDSMNSTENSMRDGNNKLSKMIDERVNIDQYCEPYTKDSRNGIFLEFFTTD